MNLLDKVKSEGFKRPFVLGIKPTGFPFLVILAPNWAAGAERRQSFFGGLIEN